jgi:hypothetical protein
MNRQRRSLRRGLLVATCFVLLLALSMAATSSGSSAGRWQQIKGKVSYGDFTVTAISATVRRPKGLAVRIVGSGFVVWACSRGFSVSSWSREYGPGFHVLGHAKGMESCDVTASASGEGVARVQIYKARW